MFIEELREQGIKVEKLNLSQVSESIKLYKVLNQQKGSINMKDYLSNKEFISTENLFDNYKRLKFLKSSIEEGLKKTSNTKILEKKYIELLEWEYELLNLYVKYNSLEQEEELIDFKKDIISNILMIDDKEVLKKLRSITYSIRFKIS